jgi:hypothetical protein
MKKEDWENGRARERSNAPHAHRALSGLDGCKVLCIDRDRNGWIHLHCGIIPSFKP